MRVRSRSRGVTLEASPSQRSLTERLLRFTGKIAATVGGLVLVTATSRTPVQAAQLPAPAAGPAPAPHTEPLQRAAHDVDVYWDMIDRWDSLVRSEQDQVGQWLSELPQFRDLTWIHLDLEQINGQWRQGNRIKVVLTEAWRPDDPEPVRQDMQLEVRAPPRRTLRPLSGAELLTTLREQQLPEDLRIRLSETVLAKLRLDASHEAVFLPYPDTGLFEKDGVAFGALYGPDGVEPQPFRYEIKVVGPSDRQRLRATVTSGKDAPPPRDLLEESRLKYEAILSNSDVDRADVTEVLLGFDRRLGFRIVTGSPSDRDDVGTRPTDVMGPLPVFLWRLDNRGELKQP